MLSSESYFKSLLPESFILHKPKDFVSGDFYWISEAEDKIFVAAIDCTGHGVPGAFMSFIGFELFRKIISLQRILEPGEVLNALNGNFEELFSLKEGRKIMDGMDVTLCAFDRKAMVLEYAGAFNPLYIIRENKLIEIKGNRFSVAADADPSNPGRKSFTNHKIKLRRDDMIYFFTDGFVDQFGGPEGKKFKYRRFRHLLLTIHDMDPGLQKKAIEESFEDWKGRLDQTDDVLVLGLRPVFRT
jgi:serine phosphatase RsbU (regulator of sigma subunit)